MVRWLFVLLIVLIPSRGHSSNSPVKWFSVGDTIRIGINAIDDPSGILDKYHAHIVTPVCEIDKCYIIELDVYWDPAGRFLRYDTIPGKGLTKLDHKPFSRTDYRKLNVLLSDPGSLLASYEKDELVRDTRKSEIDGFTGATIQDIREHVIGGAVYSCYTLWHIIHGPATDSIREATAALISPGLVRKLTGMRDQEINRFMIDNFSEADFLLYLSEVLETIRQGEGYYPKQAIERMPDVAIADRRAQRFFARNFDGMDYFTQVILLERLEPASLSEELRKILEKHVSERDSRKNDLILQLVD